MSSRKVLSVAFAVVVFAPFALGCDALKSGNAADAAVVVAPPVVAPATPPATPAEPAPGVAPVAPLGAAVAPSPVGPGGAVAPGVKPATDGGKVAVVDGGAAPATDGGKAPAAAPTPTFAIPTAIPGFDAGGFKPPAGFPTAIPTTLPTFPPPSK